MAKIVIIGAGLTGISAAYHLEKKGFHDYLIVEGKADVGGLCGSVQQDGFTFDYTGHLLHINDDYFRSLIDSVVGLETFNRIQRRSYIFSHNTYTHYPFQINLYGLPTDVITECVTGFVQRKHTQNAKSFPAWVHKHFGSGFAKHFFMPYQRKIFAHDLNNITASWTGRFVPSTSLKQILHGALEEPKDEVGYNAQFFYPKHGGIFSWVEKLAQQIKNPIRTNMMVTEVNLHHKTVGFEDGHIEPFDLLINTMPLDRLLGLIKEKSSTALKKAQNKLICNSVVNFNLGVNRADLSDKHWIYFPENQFPFYRLGFPHNFADSMAPADCSSLYGEFAHVGKSVAWVNRTLKQALDATKKLLHISDDEIITKRIMHINHAYVIYNHWREKNLKKLHQKLHDCSVYSVGRYGEWKYSSMQEAVLDGKKIAEQLVILPARKATVVKPVPMKKRKKKKELEL